MYSVHEELNKEKNLIILQLRDGDLVVEGFDFEVSAARPWDRKVLKDMLVHERNRRNRRLKKGKGK